MADKSLMEKINQGRQFRSMSVLETRAEEKDNDFIVEGYATTFDTPYTLYSADDWELREIVSRDAFNNSDMSDVIAQFDHQGKVYARVSNGTLELKADEHGLKVRMHLGGTEIGRQLYEEIRGGYITKMSFGFTVAEDEELRTTEGNKDIYTRTIKRIGKLYDVSAVSLPANDGTEISARSLIDGVIAKRMAENAKEEAEKKEKEEAEKREAEEKARKEQEAKELEMRERERLRALALE